MSRLDDHPCRPTGTTATMTASPLQMESTVVFPLIQLVIVAVPIVLAVLVVQALRVARQMGGLPPFTSTYRAYGA
jgi:hypothetical protein